mmetsp:Transcript_45685/g.126785  ORF Transcript_45685/g.126785 Transcript_45685/m.126785 type:complete len:183 (-) Transcript_45685:54-602(-)
MAPSWRLLTPAFRMAGPASFLRAAAAAGDAAVCDVTQALWRLFTGRWPPLAGELCLAGSGPLPAFVAPAQAAITADSVSGAARVGAAALETAAEVFGFSILFKKSKKMRGVHGTLNPSLWRWYHRHGYWATRRKQIDFGIKRSHRYHQVLGPGKRSGSYASKFAQYWMDKSYYRPFKNYCRF